MDGDFYSLGQWYFVYLFFYLNTKTTFISYIKTDFKFIIIRSDGQNLIIISLKKKKKK